MDCNSYNDEFTALFITNTPKETKSIAGQPSFLHLDVTAKYKHKYPKLNRAYSVYYYKW